MLRDHKRGGCPPEMKYSKIILYGLSLILVVLILSGAVLAAVRVYADKENQNAPKVEEKYEEKEAGSEKKSEDQKTVQLVKKEVKLTEKTLDISVIRQMPELDRGCEVTSLAMLIQSAGKQADKMELAEQIDKVSYNQDGYQGNPHKGFVGNMYEFSKPGYGVYHEPVFKLAKRYIDAQDLTGQAWTVMEDQIRQGKPVWVIVTSTFGPLPDSSWRTWRTKEGSVKITWREHAVLVTGFDKEHVYINDPLSGAKNKQLNKTAFVAGWEQFGRQAISY